MREALKEARKAYREDEVPIGAVVVLDGKVIARAHNQREARQSAIRHAEITAIEKACRKRKSWRLDDCDLYVTLEPCPMCAGACIQARIRHVYYGAYDPKGGSVETSLKMYQVTGYNHYPEATGGILEEECAALLKDYFKGKRSA